MLHTINGKPFFSFAELNNFGFDFDRILREAQDIMVLSTATFPTCNFGSKPQANTVRVEDLKNSPEDLLRLSGMTNFEKLRYNKIVKGLYCPWVVYPLNEFRSWSERQDPRDKWYPDAEKYMPYFISCLSQIPVIKHIGWVRIYANEAYNQVEVHYDFSENIQVDQFLYFNLTGKKTFLLDPETDERTYLDAKCLFFDAANHHGTDPEPRFNFSLRVDCVFTDEFMDQLEFSRVLAKPVKADVGVG